MNNSQCRGNTKVTGHCDSSFTVPHTYPTYNWYFDWEQSCDDHGGSGCQSQWWIIWDHDGWASRKCGNKNSNQWVKPNECGWRLGNVRATWTRIWYKISDNVGNQSSPFYFYQTCHWQ